MASDLGAAGLAVVSGMARGTDAAAHLAGEQGREVFAVPGSPLDPRNRGCNGLIRDGATLVQGAEDIVEALTGTTPQTLE